ncbi:fibrocystin-L isoform X2 [Etheostoma spectabile]|uniref:fibrocystin-L isoform X2 n=1 Tax=Etheostoma spectabile TaxID=54343 RepID=UPI0013AF5680|nr:fibrocystin-L-like isoform X2 [Etheostoma spectabile]
MAVDEQGNCVSVGVTTLTVTASLKNSRGNSVEGLEGSTTIVFSTCWANFTDLSIQNAGEDLTMVFTLKEWGTQSRAFSVRNTSTTPTPTTQAPSTQSPSSLSTNQQSTTSNTLSNLTPTTQAPSSLSTNQQSTTSMTTVSSSSTVSAGSLCLVSVIYAVACCLGGTPIC